MTPLVELLVGHSYQDKTLHCGPVSLADIAASAGTPCYVYSADDILERYHAVVAVGGADPWSARDASSRLQQRRRRPVT